MTINETILELRKERGLSQKAVADAVGISQSTIAKIEINRNEATASTIRKLSDFFGVSADYLLGRTDDFGSILPAESYFSKNDYELIEAYHTLSPDLQRLLWEQIRLWQRNAATIGNTNKKNA